MKLKKVRQQLTEEIEVIKTKMLAIEMHGQWVGWKDEQEAHNNKTKYRILYSQLAKKAIKLLSLYK